MSDAPPEAVQSRYLGGKIKLWQPAKGYRAAVDPALLAASIELKPGQLGVEFGCGVGAALMSAAHLNPGAEFLGIEQDADAAALADRNCAINDFADRVRVKCADVSDFDAQMLTEDRVKPDLRAKPQSQKSRAPDAIFFNPPFFDDPRALRSPSEDKAAAWINTTSLSDWIALALRRVREGGRVTLIQRADRLDDILAALRPKSGGIAILPVHPKADAPAKRVVVSATKSSKAPLKLLPGLILHTRDGDYTPEADAILRGDARTGLARL